MLKINDEITTWIKENHLQATDSFNLNSWSFMDTCRALEIIEASMDVLEWDETLFKYLDYIEMRAAQLVTLNSNFSILDRAQYRIQVSKTVYQLHPSGIHELMSRTTLIRRKAELWFLWDAVKPLEIQEHYMDAFIEKEQRQMTQRKFRDELANRINENMLRPAERDV